MICWLGVTKLVWHEGSKLHWTSMKDGIRHPRDHKKRSMESFNSLMATARSEPLR